MSGYTSRFPWLAHNVSGTTADTDPVVNLAPVEYNRDPVDVEHSLLTTIYAWGSVWGGASLQISISPTVSAPQPPGPWNVNHPQVAPTWFPVGDPITENGYFSFQHRWGSIKAEISNATTATAGIHCLLFDPL